VQQVSGDGTGATSAGATSTGTDGIAFDGVVAMDGPSGTGKSTVARRLAARLGARYLDTGAMYRAATLAVLRAGTSLDDAVGVAGVVEHARIEISTDPTRPMIILDGSAVSAEIRSGDVTSAVSAVSAVPAVRAVLVAGQRRVIGDAPIVVEGRDIGSVVWPAAATKLYLTASPEVRARLRANRGTGTTSMPTPTMGTPRPAAAKRPRSARRSPTRPGPGRSRTGVPETRTCPGPGRRRRC
jgi:cytidylate kinase